MLQNKVRGNQKLDAGHATENNDRFSSANAKTRERVQYKDDTLEGNEDPHSNDIKIDLTQFRSNGDKTEVIKTEAEFAEGPFYYLEKALKHAELTWAQDPFRKESSLPGKPTFDIDFSKNPAEQKNNKPIKIVNIPSEIRDPQKQLIVKGAFNPIKKLSNSDENNISKNKELELFVFNPWKRVSTTKPEHDTKRYEPPHERLLKESHTYDSSTATKEKSEFSIEDLTWTPALLRRMIDPRQPKQATF